MNLESGGLRIKNHHLTLREASIRHHTEGASRSSILVTKLVNGLPTREEISLRDCDDIVVNGSGSPAGDVFVGLEVVGEPSPVNEVGQCNLYNDRKLDLKLFKEERAKAANETDLFMVFTSMQNPDIVELPRRSGIVDGEHWDEYFGPFAGRTYRLRSHIAQQELLLKGVDERPGKNQDEKQGRQMASHEVGGANS